MALNDSDRAVLAHVVVDPDAWYAHVVEAKGQAFADQARAAKVARWRPDYELEHTKPGYKPRAEREAAVAAKSAGA